MSNTVNRIPLLAILVVLLAGAFSAWGEDAGVPLADGFAFPVGKDGNPKGYYKARGFQPNGHLGEDWNGIGGGNTDLGDPVYSAATGIVVFAQDYRMGWGNVVIIRHAYLEDGQTKFVDSLYGHLDQILVRENQVMHRGEQIGTIGTAHGIYDAHLHFEMRKDLTVGMNRSAFPRDFSVYWDPTTFIEAHRLLNGGGQLVAVPIHTFNTAAPPLYAGPVTSIPSEILPVANPPRIPKGNVNSARGPFRVDRYSDLRERMVRQPSN